MAGRPADGYALGAGAEADVLAAAGAEWEPFAVITVTFGAPLTGLITTTRLPGGTTTTCCLAAVIEPGTKRNASHGRQKLNSAAAADNSLTRFLVSRFVAGLCAEVLGCGTGLILSPFPPPWLESWRSIPEMPRFGPRSLRVHQPEAWQHGRRSRIGGQAPNPLR